MKLEKEEETEDIYADPKGAPGLQFEERPARMKSWSETVKNSPQPEAEHKGRPRTEVSPQGPKPGLGHGSEDGLIAGDQVLFLTERIRSKKELWSSWRKLLKELWSMSREPPVCSMFLCSVSRRWSRKQVQHLYSIYSDIHTIRLTTVPPPSDTEDLYSAAPPVDSLGVDSVVEIDLANGVKGYGTIRWTGFLPGVAPEMAGLELEDQRGVSDGTFKGQRFFKCPDKHALFVKLSSCRPDSRFIKTSPNHNAPNMGCSANHSGPYHNGVTPHHGEFDLEPVPPVAAEDVERLLIGRMKGIQGHHNSCYMDSALFRDGFVEGRHVMNLRKQLQKHGFSQSFTTDEKGTTTITTTTITTTTTTTTSATTSTITATSITTADMSITFYITVWVKDEKHTSPTLPRLLSYLCI
uniref:ubiquitinyl hydrolase 1 n=1 Tax=Neogobius melanostomus TaxID=47308 RepID=A0A8C6S2L8_9GOBI